MSPETRTGSQLASGEGDMATLQRALDHHEAQERERELARELRRRTTRSILRRGQFDGMRLVIPRWWEWLSTGQVYGDDEIAELIDQRLAETTGLALAIIADWA
jgi:hypothetical protein